MWEDKAYAKGFVPYGLAAFLIGLVGGFSAVLAPAFVQDLGLDYNNTTWTALAQAMSTAACAPILGRLGDVAGRRRTLLGGIGVFALGNVLSALANSLWVMLAARFVVGVGIAAMAPVIMAYIVAEFPKEKVGKGFALYMLISSAAVIVGPAAGGIIIARWGWRWMMWLCSGMALAVLAACLACPKEQALQRQGMQAFDALGAALALVFFSLLLCLPSFGQNLGWLSPAFVIALVVDAISLVALLAVERRAQSPLLSGALIGRRSFILSVLALFLTQGLMQANMTCSIVFVNYVRGEGASVSGYGISVMYLGMSLGAALLGPMADRHPPKGVLCLSLVLTGVGCGLLLLFSEALPVWLIITALGVLGLGLGGGGTIFMKVALSGLPPQQAGAGTGVYGLFRDLAAPFGVAVLVPLFTNRITALTTAGVQAASAAVTSIRMLATVELCCVAAGVLVVLMLPSEQGGKA